MEEKASSGVAAMVENVPGLRQILLLVGLAASIAVGLSAVLWSREPDYTLLYGSLAERDAAEVVQALQASAIPYRLDAATGAIRVSPDSVHEARLKLAADGLPRSSGVGLEMIQGEGGFTVSQFMETARYQHVLETELARTIVALRAVDRARVHLALPRHSAFIRRRKEPGASVLLHLFPGRSLEPPQVAAIVNLVSSSIPDMSPNRVTVVDQFGNMLSAPQDSTEFAVSAKQFEFQRRLEDAYSQRVEDILSPILGPGRVRASVSAELDFTSSEETRESFDPDRSVVRSEQTSEDVQLGDPAVGGVPGALSNQPPANVPATPILDPAAADEAPPEPQPVSEARRTTRNFEIDRTVSHVRTSLGSVRRLSVAVLVDNHRNVAENGTIVSEPLSQTELEEVRTLVRETVGFDAERGDSVSVINASFQELPAVEPLPEPSLLDSGWMRDLLRQLATIGVLIALVLGVVRPALASLTAAARRAPAHGAVQVGMEARGAGPAPPPPPQLTYEERIVAARNMANQNPERVAQIVKDWVTSDG